ncbi:LysM peptidoglycan-binding domain-containing protein [Thiohalocapsa marina]|uniref:LysM peptidoglycan-binding domain-containing protein n=1 Tax=Thiohalocapsa marina TaxID=424902 RepID=UPI0036DD6415
MDLVSGDWPQAVLERLDAQGALLRQLQVQLDALSDADGLPQGSPDADVAEDKLAELGARLQQQQQAASEAQLRAEKAEKRAAGLEEAQARMVTENERLALELATAKTRLAEALQRVVELNARLATSEARAAAGTAGSGRQTVAEPTPSSTAVAGAQAAGSASPAEPGAAYPKVTDRQGAEPDGEGAMTDQVPDQGAAQRAAQDSAMIPVPVIYEVLADDTLSRISAKVYGDANAWRRIFEANRDLLDSPDDLSLGMKLVIP